MVKKNRRSLKRNKRKNLSNTNLCVVGVNAAGMSSKLSSFENLLRTKNPSVFFVQETHFQQEGRFNSEVFKKYKIWELVRKEKSGGGLVIGALIDVDPVFISEGDDEVEIIVIQIIVDGLPIRCICAYGPQEYEKVDKKEKFWARLSHEVQESLMNDNATIVQMDGNLWGGPEIINNDPNKINNNGKLFKDFIETNTHLKIGNNLDVCRGSITRHRKTIHKEEKSILDFFLFCDRIAPYVTDVLIDEDNLFTLSNYSKVKGRVDSDHNTMIATFSLKKETMMEAPVRQEFKDSEHFYKTPSRHSQRQFDFVQRSHFDLPTYNRFAPLGNY